MAEEVNEPTEAPTEAPAEAEAGEVNVEDKARNIGWVPEDEFKGDKAKWRPADEFLQRGEEVIGFVKKDRDKFRQEATKLRDKVSSLEKDTKAKLKNLERMSKVALEQQRAQLTAQYGNAKEQAVETGDLETYRAIEKNEKEALSDLDKKTAPENAPGAEGIPAAAQATVDGWVADNRWFEADDEMRVVAGTYHGKLLNEKPGLTLEENLAEVRTYVKKRYPEKFSNSSEKRGSPVEGGGRGGEGGKSLWMSLDADVRKLAESQIKDGQFAVDGDGNEIKDVSMKRKRYAEIYFGDSA